MSSFVDALGRSFEFASPPRRVVSLVPSLTETLFDIGAGDAVVGVTGYCLFPAECVSALPKLGGTKNPDVDAIRVLEPDLVYVNLEENLGKHAAAVAEFAPVFATEPKGVADVVDLIRLLGRIHAAAFADERAREIESAAASILASSRTFTFACPIWQKPWMWCGGDTYVSSLVTTAGGSNVFGSEMRYPQHPLEEVIARKPDIVFLPDEPYEFTTCDAGAIEKHGIAVVGPFPGHLFTWHGTRTLHGLRFLAETVVSIWS